MSSNELLHNLFFTKFKVSISWCSCKNASSNCDLVNILTVTRKLIARSQFTSIKNTNIEECTGGNSLDVQPCNRYKEPEKEQHVARPRSRRSARDKRRLLSTDGIKIDSVNVKRVKADQLPLFLLPIHLQRWKLVAAPQLRFPTFSRGMLMAVPAEKCVLLASARKSFVELHAVN